jgi:thymidine phosphorylase
VLAQELIRRKRDGLELAGDEVAWLVRGIADGSVSDAQVGALAMAIVLRGMTRAERVALTTAMRDSGDVLRWEGLEPARPVLDKHSTGGVGDKVSLLLAPIIAACGGAVPMISGRGLGHTGGTLDKLEAIPGYDTTPAPERLRTVVASAGCAIVGQTARLAPADRRLYAIRDATGTVESIPLIVASILSKKLAAGLDALVMDVKVGSGAFLPDLDGARELAAAIVEVAGGAGLRAGALLTDMDRVLGRTAGNAVEVREAIDHLTGAAHDERLVAVTIALSRELLALGGLDGTDPAEALRSGAAAERFAAMVAALGGPADLLEAPDRHLARAPVIAEAAPAGDGIVQRVDVRAVGLAIIDLGGGRRREDDAIDHAVGLAEVAAPGERVGAGGRPLAVVHARDEASVERAVSALRAAFTVGEARAAGGERGASAVGDGPEPGRSPVLERLAPADDD